MEGQVDQATVGLGGVVSPCPKPPYPSIRIPASAGWRISSRVVPTVFEFIPASSLPAHSARVRCAVQ